MMKFFMHTVNDKKQQAVTAVADPESIRIWSLFLVWVIIASPKFTNLHPYWDYYDIMIQAPPNPIIH